MKLAVLGAGMIVRDLLSVVGDLPGVQVQAIFGRETQWPALDELAKAHGIPDVWTDLDAMLASPEIDTVYVGLPNHLHHGYSRAALLAGKHVICEKPFTLTLGEFDDLSRLAQERGLILVEAVTTMYLANFRALRARIGELGTLKLVQCVYTQYSSRYPAFLAGETPPAFDPAKGGGALRDIGVYAVHFVVGLLGRPARATYTANVERGVDTSGVLVLEYDGVTAVCVCAKDSASPPRTIIQGSAGTIEMPGSPNVCGPFDVTLRGAGTETVDVSSHPHRMADEFREFSRMISELDFAERDRQLRHGRVVTEIVTDAIDRGDA